MAERTDLTTKELGEAIVFAVVGAYLTWQHSDKSPTDAPMVDALFRVLEENNCWFMRVSEHADGTRFEQMEMFK